MLRVQLIEKITEKENESKRTSSRPQNIVTPIVDAETGDANYDIRLDVEGKNARTTWFDNQRTFAYEPCAFITNYVDVMGMMDDMELEVGNQRGMDKRRIAEMIRASLMNSSGMYRVHAEKYVAAVISDVFIDSHTQRSSSSSSALTYVVKSMAVRLLDSNNNNNNDNNNKSGSTKHYLVENCTFNDLDNVDFRLRPPERDQVLSLTRLPVEKLRARAASLGSPTYEQDDRDSLMMYIQNFFTLKLPQSSTVRDLEQRIKREYKERTAPVFVPRATVSEEKSQASKSTCHFVTDHVSVGQVLHRVNTDGYIQWKKGRDGDNTTETFVAQQKKCIENLRRELLNATGRYLKTDGNWIRVWISVISFTTNPNASAAATTQSMNIGISKISIDLYDGGRVAFRDVRNVCFHTRPPSSSIYS